MNSLIYFRQTAKVDLVQTDHSQTGTRQLMENEGQRTDNSYALHSFRKLGGEYQVLIIINYVCVNSHLYFPSESPFPVNRFYDDNMCGVSNLQLKKPEPPEEFSCPYMKPEVSVWF